MFDLDQLDTWEDGLRQMHEDAQEHCREAQALRVQSDEVVARSRAVCAQALYVMDVS